MTSIHTDNKISISDRLVRSILKYLSMWYMPLIPKQDQMDIKRIIAAEFFEWSVQEADLLMKIITDN